MKIEIFLLSEADTRAMAKAIASIVKIGDVILLNGDLGTGKTFFVKALTDAIGYTGLVTSPTYTLENIYRSDRLAIIHADLYRMNRAEEISGLALDEEQENALVLIEWGGKFADYFEDPLMIELFYADESLTHRRVEIHTDSQEWYDRLKMALADFLK